MRHAKNLFSAKGAISFQRGAPPQDSRHAKTRSAEGAIHPLALNRAFSADHMLDRNPGAAPQAINAIASLALTAGQTWSPLSFSGLKARWTRRWACLCAKKAFALYEVLIGLFIFSIGIVALGRAVNNCMTASALSADDARVRDILANRMVEIETT